MARQRRLGAVEAEVVDKPGLPALVVPASSAELEGWTADDLMRWMESFAVRTEDLRLAVGLGLCVLRQKLSEAEYGSAIDRLADRFNVTASSLWRWRKSAEEHFKIDALKGSGRGPKSLRSAKSEKKSTSDDGGQSRGANAVPPGDTLSGEAQPPDGEPETAAGNGRGSSPSPAGSASPRGAQGPVEPTSGESEGEFASSGDEGAAPDSSAQETPDPPPADPAPGVVALDEPAGDAGPPTTERSGEVPDGVPIGTGASSESSEEVQQEQVEQPVVLSREQQVDANFDRFFSADALKVAKLSNMKTGLARLATLRKWVERYEMGVKGVEPMASNGVKSRKSVEVPTNFKKSSK